VGNPAVMTDPAEMDAYLSEPRDLYRGRALCIVRPKDASEVASVLALCNERGVGVVPQGGNTGLVGGQTPDMSGRQIVLSLQRLDRVRDVDPASDAMTLEAGVTLARAQEVAESVERFFPLSLASEGSCTIGGNLATNAGGVHVLAYGAARDLVLGLEVALADGRVLSTLGKLRKDNTGYNLTQLFVGSEGTLGVITAATLKLFPRPRSRAVAFVGLADPAAALTLLNFMKDRAGPALQAFELLPRIGLDLVLRHIPGARDPLAAPHAWYALIEIVGYAEGEAERVAGVALAQAHDAGLAQDATLSHSLDQAAALWRLRESMSEAQKREGGSIKHDISVPIERIPEFIDEAGRRVAARFPQARPVPFGHMGDGNLHYNVSQPVGADKATFLGAWDEMNEIVHGLVHEFSGSISAEHGIGRLKRDLLTRVKDPVALDVMRALKQTLDPKGILNPGALL
jgi:FAD/FMN-containing dehydrogenase